MNRLIALFPDEENAIRKYFKDMAKVSRWASMHIAGKVLPKFVNLLGCIFTLSGRKLALSTTGEYLRSHFKNEKLRALLATIWGDYGLPPAKSAFAIHCMVAQAYFNGAHYPAGGGKSIASSIKPVIEKYGGKCLLNTEVTRLITENNKAVGVKVKTVKGEKNEYDIYAPIIYSNIGAYNTFKYLLKDYTKPAEIKSLESMQTGDSAVSLYVGLNGDPAKLGFSAKNIWICGGYDHDKIQKENNVLAEAKSCFLSFPSLKSKDGYNHVAEIITFVNYDIFKNWENSAWRNRCEEYYSMKDTITNKLLNLVEKNFPGFKDMVSFTELSTPLTMKSFVNWNKGMYNGIPATPERYKLKFLQPRTQVKNFYLTGCDVSSLGIVGAMMGGVVSASLQSGALGFFKIITAVKKEKAKVLNENKVILTQPNPAVSAI